MAKTKTQAKRETGAMADRIRSARAKAGLTQEGLARRAELTSAAISRIERGVAPRVRTLKRIAAALGVPAAELLD
jgi:transcriptional regulator with XRE-family HTH domain